MCVCPNGSTSTIATAYNIDGSLASLTNSTGTTSYQYDANGNVSQMTSANGSIISYVRDTQDRVLSQTEKANAGAIDLTTSYDVYGKVLTVTDSRNRTTTMTYDVVNRLATKTLPNGVKTTYGYDDLDRVTSIVYAKADGTILASETYTRNIGGEPSKVLREDGTYTLYEYDAAVRLSKETAFSAGGVVVKAIEYSYDLDGKRIRKVDRLVAQDYTYNANGQLVTAGQNGYVYDVDGRLSQVTKAGGVIALAHDAFDQLTQVTNNGVTTQYLYDAQGDRIGEVSGSNTKNYLVAPNISNGLSSTDLVTDGNGGVVSDYVYGGSSIIARLDANGNPIYYLTDAMGSVIGLVDDQGNILSRIIYDGFGNIESGDDGSTAGGDFRFQGQWLESESGLYYMRARNYDAETGMFLSRDPVDMQEQGVEAFNPYQFAFNNPLIYSDPSGMFTLIELNSTVSIQNTLDSIKASSYQQFRSYAKDKIGEVLGNAFTGFIKKLVPFADSASFVGILDGTAGKGGGPFEDFLQGQICGVFKALGGSFANDLWIEPSVSYQNGNPTANGINCTELFNGKLNVKGKGSRPDFIYKRGEPMAKDNEDNKAYIIGDIKVTMSKVFKELGIMNGSANVPPSNQWTAMSKYAKGYVSVPMVLYTTFRRNDKGTTELNNGQVLSAKLAQAYKLSAAKGVFLIIANLMD